MNNIKALATHLEENARIDSIPAEYLAGLYLEQYGTPTVKELENNLLIDWAEEVDGNGFYYADTVEEFAQRIYHETAEEEEEEFLESWDNFINWQHVWERQLRHDWISWKTPNGELLFIMNF